MLRFSKVSWKDPSRFTFTHTLWRFQEVMFKKNGSSYTSMTSKKNS